MIQSYSKEILFYYICVCVCVCVCVCIYIYILFQILFHYRLIQDIEYSFPCLQTYVLYVVVCIC